MLISIEHEPVAPAASGPTGEERQGVDTVPQSMIKYKKYS